MNNEEQLTNVWSVIGVISLIIPIVLGLLLLNWFFQITPFQKLEGAPLLVSIFISPLGVILGYISFVKTGSKSAQFGIMSNGILLVLPFVYFFFGTIIFGP